MTLRRLFILDGCLMLILGWAFFGYDELMAAQLGVEWHGQVADQPNLWKAMSLGGPFGGALMAFGFAALAVSRSKDPGFRRSASGFFLAGHAAVAVIFGAKQMAFWETQPGFLIMDALALPGAGFLYFLITDRTPFANELAERGGQESRIREVAGQEERNRLAQDLHDSVKQQLYSIQTNLAAAQARWDTDSVGARDAVDRARTSTHESMTEMSALLDRLRRDPLESVGLVEALRRQCEALGYQTGAEVTTHFGALPGPDRVPPESMTATFRIAQEALANVARHARARQVRLSLAFEEEAGQFELEIQDDGQGFDTSQAGSGMGLANMQSRASEVGGLLDIDSVPGSGSTIRLRVPAIDPIAARAAGHQSRLVAVSLALVPTAFFAVMWANSRPFVVPLVAIGGAFVVFHGLALVVLRRPWWR